MIRFIHHFLTNFYYLYMFNIYFYVKKTDFILKLFSNIYYLMFKIIYYI